MKMRAEVETSASPVDATNGSAFSLGLAVVLMAIGCAVLFAKNLLPESSRISTNPFFRYVPVASAAFIVCVGLVMTGVSLGWV